MALANNDPPGGSVNPRIFVEKKKESGRFDNKKGEIGD